MDYPAVSYRNQQYPDLPPGTVYNGQFFGKLNFGILFKINLFFFNNNCWTMLYVFNAHNLFKCF